MSAAVAASAEFGVRPVCVALDLAPATYYRNRYGPMQGPPRPRPRSPRALSPAERQTVLDLLISTRFCDDAPRQIWAALLDEGRHYCSVSTMYRILRGEHAVRCHQA